MELMKVGNQAIKVVVLLSLSEKYLQKNKCDAKKLTDMVNDIADEQLVVDSLEPEILTSWFRKNNPDCNLKNVLVYPNKADLEDKKIAKILGTEDFKADSLIIQVMLDKRNNVTRCRSVEFEEIAPKLEELFESNDGVMIVE